MSPASRIILGTVQFGLDYGISNRAGKVPFEEVCSILKTAQSCGITMLDTAHGYGDSEAVIGNAMKATASGFSIVTKTNATGAAGTRNQLMASLSHLGQDSLYAGMLHHFSLWESHRETWEMLLQMRDAGKLQLAGISLYHPEEWDALEEAGCRPDIVQIPFSIFDRRFQSRLERIHAYGTVIHARSAFLQGLAFMDPAALPVFFQQAAEPLRRLRTLSIQTGISIAGICMGFVLSHASVKGLVIGVESARHLKQNLEEIPDLAGLQKWDAQMDGVAIRHQDILLPYRWPART